MIAGINESKILTKHIPCECKYKFSGWQWNANEKWNNDICWCEWKKSKEHNAYQKDYIWNPASCSCENVKYLASTIDDSVITSDEVVNDAESVSANIPTNVSSNALTNFLTKK